MSDYEKLTEAYATIGLVLYQHIEDMLLDQIEKRRPPFFDDCDGDDQARASALYRTAFNEGWAVPDLEDKLRDLFDQAYQEYRQRSAELNQESAEEFKRGLRDV